MKILYGTKIPFQFENVEFDYKVLWSKRQLQQFI